MKIFGVFRGFPGLGRVMSGISILQSLSAMGHEVRAYSYLQGEGALVDHNIDMILDKQPTRQHVMVIGLNPISDVAGELFEIIQREEPDLLILDGEPLFISTLAMVYPRKKILTLLNPSDIHNSALPVSSIIFYRRHYFSAGYALVHGINAEKIQIPVETYGCEVHAINTILREEILEINKSSYGNKIVGILGGGCNNASENFFHSTIEMGKRIIEAATFLKEERFEIYCNDKNVAKQLIEYVEVDNVSIVANYTVPTQIYSDAKAVICRAGRNTVSELLYLDIPALLLSSSGDFRTVEQDKNIDEVCEFRPGRILKTNINETGHMISGKIKEVLDSREDSKRFVPGNQIALELINKVLGI